jgi:asparagine synthase (glutamine-hydrolysing)
LPAGEDWAVQDYIGMWEERPQSSTLNRLLVLNLQTYLLDDLLPKVDRMSMAHGLEVRSPFLDTELLELALALPDRARIRRFTLKRVLKHAMADLLPHEILERPKQGFGVPLGRWFRSDLRRYLDGHLCSPSSRLRAHVEGTALDRLVAEHQSGRTDHGNALWALLTLEVFLRQQDW